MREVKILSPHRDDALFSLFFALRRWSGLPLYLHVVNFFTVSSYAPWANSAESGVVSAIRRREDRRALRQIDDRIKVTDAHLLDAPLRLNIDWSEVCAVNQRPPLAPDDKTKLMRLMRIMGDSLALAPLALGDHVDHWAVHNAAIETTAPTQLGFYEDLPYASWTSETATLERVNDTSRAVGIPLVPVIIRAAGHASSKERASARYDSQIDRAMARTIAEYGSRYGCGERIWLPRHVRRGWHAIA